MDHWINAWIVNLAAVYSRILNNTVLSLESEAKHDLTCCQGFINALNIRPCGGVVEEQEYSAGVQLKTKTYLHHIAGDD